MTGEELHRQLLELVRSVGFLQVATAGVDGQVSLSELFTLHELDGGSLAQQELAARLRLDKSTVSRLVAGLEDRGLVVRERDPANRRIVKLSITAAGRRLHRELGRAMHARQAPVLEGMTAAERTALCTGLTGLLRALHEAASTSAGRGSSTSPSCR